MPQHRCCCLWSLYSTATSQHSFIVHCCCCCCCLYCHTKSQQQQGLLEAINICVFTAVACRALRAGGGGGVGGHGVGREEGDGFAHQENRQAGHGGQRHHLALQLEEHTRGQYLLQRLPLWIKWIFQPWQGTCKRKGCIESCTMNKPVCRLSLSRNRCFVLQVRQHLQTRS